MKTFFETSDDETPREPDASELERTLWIRSLLGPDVSVGQADALAQRIRETFVAKGRSLYRQGDAADRIYFIVRGQIALRHSGIKTRDFGPRDVLGVIDALQDRPHAFDAIVREDTVALELEVEDWFEFLEDNFDLCCSIILRLARGLPPTSPTRPDLIAPTARRRPKDAQDPTSRESYRASLGPRLALSFIERLAVLRACPALAKANIQALSRLARFAEIQYLETEERTFLTARSFYVVEFGRVRALASNPESTTWTEEVGAGSAVGGLGLLEAGLYDIEVTALESSSIFRIPVERLFDVMEDHFQLALSLFAHLASEAESLTLEQQRISEISASRSAARQE